MFSGYIHDELRDQKSGSLFDGVLDLQEKLLSVIAQLVEVFGRVHVLGVTGNHGRLDRKPRHKLGVQDNVDWLLYQFLRRFVQADSELRRVVSFQIPDSVDALYKIYSVRYLLTHGNHGFRGGSGIAGPATPWALGDHKRRKRQMAVDLPYDTLIMGHWHMLSWGANNAQIVNGSLKGFDEYAFDNAFGFEPPKQALWFTHPEHGITHKMDVYCDEPAERSAERWLTVAADQLNGRETR